RSLALFHGHDHARQQDRARGRGRVEQGVGADARRLVSRARIVARRRRDQRDARSPETHGRRNRQAGRQEGAIPRDRSLSPMKAVVRYAPFALYASLAIVVGTWIVDDAGISYAYARNVGHGYGFVSQPGLPPVEGFSNFLWVIVLSPFFLIRLFHPVYVPKLIAAGLVFLSFAMIQRSLRRATDSDASG